MSLGSSKACAYLELADTVTTPLTMKVCMCWCCQRVAVWGSPRIQKKFLLHYPLMSHARVEQKFIWCPSFAESASDGAYAWWVCIKRHFQCNTGHLGPFSMVMSPICCLLHCPAYNANISTLSAPWLTVCIATCLAACRYALAFISKAPGLYQLSSIKCTPQFLQKIITKCPFNRFFFPRVHEYLGVFLAWLLGSGAV